MSKFLKKCVAMLLALSMISSFVVTGWAADETDSHEHDHSADVELKLEEIDPATLHVEREGLVSDEDEPAVAAEPYALTDRVRVSILLEEPGALDAGYSAQGVGTNSAAQSYRSALRASQDTMARRISETVLGGEPLRVKWNLTLAANIIAAEVPYGKIDAIRRLDGVQDVVLETRYAPAETVDEGSVAYPNMTGARDMTNSNGTYSSQYTGAGRRVAIIDTGLDTDHQSFNADAFNYAVNEAGASGQLLTQTQVNSLKSSLNGKNGTYLSAKIPFAYNYIDNNTTVNHTGDTQGEHGSHVAGIAAANRYLKSGSSYVSAAEQVGVVGQAPDAQVMVMKVFGSGGGAYDSDYMAAIEDAIVLGADAANLSLGSALPGITTVSTTYQSIMSGLVSKGMVVSISMGNNTSWDSNKQLYADDVNLHTGGSPGSYANALTVASVDDSGTSAPYLLFNNQLELRYLEGGGSASNAAMTTVAGTYSYIYLDSYGTSAEFTSLKSLVNGKVALCNRGSTSFYEKANAAMAAGAVALIVVNNQAGTISMALDGYTYTKPVVSIKQSEGAAIKAMSSAQTSSGVTYYTGTIKVGGADDLTAMAYYEMSSFSSWGVPGSLILKPEITAPGGGVKSLNGYHKEDSSTYAGGHDAYELMSGTSMAAPQITGISAVIGEYYAENGIQTKTGLPLRKFAQSVLMSTATPVLEAESGAYYSLLKQGAGLANVDAAVSAKTYILMNEDATASYADGKVKAELGDRPERDGVYSFSFTVNNLTDKDVTFEAPVTDLFTQALENDGANLSHLTRALGAANEGVSYVWDAGESTDEGHDVNMDGVTDGRDAQAILDYLTDTYPEDQPFDEEAANLDGSEDGKPSTYDAHLLLNWTPGSGGVSGYTVPANGQAAVTVNIRLTAAQLAILNDEHRDGAYVEAFVKLTEKNGVTHSIPVLAFHGSWTDPSMFDAVRYEESYLGTTQSSYFGASDTNGMQIRNGTATAWVTGNPYVKETPFPADRLAVKSDATIYQVKYNLIRAGAVGVGITKDDGTVLYSTTPSFNQSAAYYNTQLTTPAWQNTTTSSTSINKTVSSLSLNEGNAFTAGVYAVPEYYAYRANGSDKTSAVSSDQFKTLLKNGTLGKGAYIGYTFTVDNTAPSIVSAQAADNKLTVTVRDNRYVACVKLMNTSGNTTYETAVPEQSAPGQTASYTFDLTGKSVGNTVTIFVGDYAGNETAAVTTLDGGAAVMERTAYVLTGTLTAGNDYLIVSRNTTGSGYALGHSGTSVAADAVTVKAADDTFTAPYIDSADVDATSVWTVSGSYVFQNGSYYLRRSSTSLNIGTSNTTNVWSWDGTNNRLSIVNSNRTYYLRYSGSTFSLNTAANSVYLFQKTTVTEELDLNKVESVTVTPASASLYTGNTAQLSAEVLPVTAADRSVTWTSSSTAVATVNDSGLVTAVGPGTATITAASVATPDVKGTATVTVSAATAMPGAAVNAQLAGDSGASFVRIDLGDMSVETLGQAGGVHYGGGRSDDIIIGFQTDGSVVETDITDGSYESGVIGSFSTTDYNSRDGAHIPDLSAESNGETVTETYISIYAASGYLLLMTPNYSITGWTLSGLAALTYIGTDTEAGKHYYYALNDSGLMPMVLGVDEDEPVDEDGALNVTLGTGSATAVSNLPYGAEYMSMSLLDNGGYYGLLIANTNTREIYFVDLTQETLTAVVVAGFSDASGLTTLYNDDYDVSVVPMPDSAATARMKAALQGAEAVKMERLGTLESAGRPASGSLNAFRGGSPAVKPAAKPAVSGVNGAETPVENDDGTVSLTISESGSTNGWYFVEYDPEVLELTGVETKQEYISYDADPAGVVSVTFASKEALTSANKDVATLTFRPVACGGEETIVYVSTIERSDVLDVNEEEELPVQVPEHAWGEWTVTTEPTCTEAGEETRACSRCGETETREVPALGHDYVAAVTEPTCTERGYTTHTCSRCGDSYVDSYVDALGHDWGEWTVTTEPTCTEAGEETRTCSRCGETETREVPALGHDYVAVVTEPTCTEKGCTTHTCSRCGDSYVDTYVDALGHDWGIPSYQWTEVDNGWSVTAAAACRRDETHTVTETVRAMVTATVEPGCETAGYYDYTATFVKEMFTSQTKRVEIPAVGHEWVFVDITWTGNDTDGYTAAEANFKCSRCNTAGKVQAAIEKVSTSAGCVEAGTVTYTATVTAADSLDGAEHADTKKVTGVALGHAWGEWTVTTEPTCTEAGEETRTCSRCGETETREVPALGHDYVAVVTAPTCTEKGYTTHTCSRCGDSYVDTYVDALGHDWGEWTVTTEPTCTEAGEETRTCSRCGEKETREVPALGHDYAAVVTAPTCTEKGYTTHTCSRCGDSYVDTYVDALGHAWGEWTVTTAPSCTEAGEETRACSRCGETETREVPALGHDYVAAVTAPTCTEKGYTTHTCSRCGDSYVDTYVDALGHAWGEPAYEWSADNSTVTGTAVCANDAAHRLVETVNTTSQVTREPTREEAGERTYTAVFTNPVFTTQTKVEEIPALTGATIQRLWGQSRTATAAAIAEAAFPNGAENVILASGDNYPDALAGGPLAYALDAPILLVCGSNPDEVTLKAIDDLKAKNVYILGGVNAISDGVREMLETKGLTVTRVADTSRFGTAVKVAEELDELRGTTPTEVFFVYAMNYPDALAVGNVAAIKGAPILYIGADGVLDDVTRAYLDGCKDTLEKIYIIGGTGVISEDAETNLGAYVDKPERVWGHSRYETCINVNTRFADVLDGETLCLACGFNYPDALAGSVLAAKERAPLLLVDRSLSEEQKTFIRGRAPSRVFIFGGTGAVSEQIYDEVWEIVR